MKSAVFRKMGLLLWTLGLLISIYMMFQLSVPYVSFEKNVDFLATKQNVYHKDYWRFSFYAHVFVSIFVLPAGFTQFNRSLIRSRFHRVLGMVYIIPVIFIAAPTGFLMGINANGGLAARTSFVLLSILWFTTTLVAYINVRKKKYLLHGEYMLFSYALALSAITLRLYALLFDLFNLHVRPQEVYVTIAWLSWVPNLFLAYILVKGGFIKRLMRAHS